MKKRLFALLLTCALLLAGLTACGKPDETFEVTVEPAASSQPEAPAPEPEVLEEEPPAEEPPLGFPLPQWMEEENALLEQHRQALLDDPEGLLALLNGRLLAFREGSFEEVPNHHAPWPEDFPSPQSVDYPLTREDYVVWMTAYEPIDESSWYDGELSVWVRLDDQSHYMVLKPAWFGSADSEEPTLGFSDSRFSAEEPFFGFDDVWKLQNP